MKTREPQVVYHGPVAEHDMPCAVCWKRPAVLQFGSPGTFQPCWTCQQEQGWKLKKGGFWWWLKEKLTTA